MCPRCKRLCAPEKRTHTWDVDGWMSRAFLPAKQSRPIFFEICKVVSLFSTKLGFPQLITEVWKQHIVMPYSSWTKTSAPVCTRVERVTCYFIAGTVSHSTILSIISLRGTYNRWRYWEMEGVSEDRLTRRQTGKKMILWTNILVRKNPHCQAQVGSDCVTLCALCVCVHCWMWRLLILSALISPLNPGDKNNG